MNELEKSVILDDLAIAILQDGQIELSLDLEEYDDLRSDRRWQEISRCLREVGVSEKFSLFCQETPDWEAAKKILSQAK